MSSRFPHLTKANAWPGLATVDPFDLQVTFDPYLWTPDVTIHLARTALDSGYRNVGGWESASARDSWFDSVSDRTLQVDSEMHILPGVEIKLPFAFEVLQGYDHLYIDFPPTPTEGGSDLRHRYYYFLEDVQYRSPSSTACIITLDEWTTHLFDLNLTWIDLDRGHAPLAATSAEEFLSDPIGRCDHLTVPDESFGSITGRVTHTATEVLNQGAPWAVLVMSADPGQSPGTFGDSDWRTPTTHSWGTQGAASYSTVAVEPAELSGVLDDMENQAPQVFASLMACFLIPKKYVTVTRTIQFLGRTLRVLDGGQVLKDFVTLTPSMFGYPERYSDIAKLYTSPYAVLSLTDSEGREQTIRVEDTTGRLRLSTVASIVYPMLGFSCHVLGIGDGGTATLQWNAFTSRDLVTGGDWASTLRKFGIPTYAVIANPERTYRYSQHWDRVQRGSAIDEALRQAKLGASTQKSLTDGGLDRTVARVAQKHAEQDAVLSLSLTAAAGIRAQQRSRILGDMGDDATVAGLAYQAQQEQTYLMSQQAQARADLAQMRDSITTGVAIGAAAIAGGGLIATVGGAYAAGGTMAAAFSSQAGMAALAGFGGAIYGAVQDGMHLDGAMLEASQEQASLTMAATNNEQLYRATSGTYYISKRDRMTSTQDAIYALQDGLRSDSLDTQQTYEAAIVAADVALGRSQAATQKSTADNMAEGSATLNRLSLETDLRKGKIMQPDVLASVGGDMSSVTGPAAISIQVRTQDAGAIAAAGDAFLRYGYRDGGRQWSLSRLNVMSKFTYWEGRARMGSGSISAQTRETISAIFAAGTTVWRNPSEIGSASIYDNRRPS